MHFYNSFVIFITSAIFLRKGVECNCNSLNGRYTKSIENFRVFVPFQLNHIGEFHTYVLPNYYEHNFGEKTRKKRNPSDSVHYALHLNDNEKYHVELWPNHDFMSPNLVFETRRPNDKVQDKMIRNLDKRHFCHYTGQIRGYPNSKVALSTCNGLAGYVSFDNKRYFIEPVEDHEPNEFGQHLHVVYEKNPNLQQKTTYCGTNDEKWENIWKKRFKDQMLMENQHNISKRGLTSVHRYLETLVVCDKKFLDHHKNTDYEQYVLTVMNMVADFYHDASSGNQMDVVVVRIMYLDKEEEEIDLEISPDADKTLASFCKWQEKINPKDISSPNHHDIAVLLTRYDICADNMSNCGLMGLAYVASACTGNEPCAINEDGGLVLGIVVAHEMGHVMGCAHDKEGESTCPAQDTDESYFVMAPFVHLYTTRWSTCSRAFITSLFENNLGECLNDEPDISLYQLKETLPGTIYDADAQCNMNFPNSTVCIINDDNFCEMLLCKTTPTTCMSKEEPPADGTKCGENKWCFRKECVQIGERPEAINGGWGEWGEWSTCSRTCGGGVSISSRDCNNPIPQHKGSYCIGERKKIKTCNLDPCPEGSPSFRDVQCAEHNNKTVGDKLYNWKAYYVKDEPCVLYCINEIHIYTKMEPRAKDGTPCKPGTKDICVSGSCKILGCDGVIDSTAVEDICGICNGDGTQCKIIDEIYSDVGANGLKKIATIPAGSRKIHYEELGTSINTLAVSDKTEKNFFLNGNYTEAADGIVKIGKVDGYYSHPEPGKELLIINGPLDDDIILFVVFYKEENVGYEYKYAEMSPDLSYTPHYQWELLEWNECSVKCGGGFQQPQYVCVEDKVGKVSENFCNNIKKPNDDPKKCNDQPCKTKWKVGKWSKCYACKHKSGVRMREVECVRESPRRGAEDILVEDKECNDPKPGRRELCNSPYKCKTRRFIDNLPDDQMEHIWLQTYNNNNNRKSIITRDLNEDDFDGIECSTVESTVESVNITTTNSTTATTTATTKKVHLDVGKIVADRIPSEEIKLIKVALKPSHLSNNLSDSVFETMGDSVGDSIDTGKAVESKGEKAVEILNAIEHGRNKSVHKNNRTNEGKP